MQAQMRAQSAKHQTRNAQQMGPHVLMSAMVHPSWREAKQLQALWNRPALKLCKRHTKNTSANRNFNMLTEDSPVWAHDVFCHHAHWAFELLIQGQGKLHKLNFSGPLKGSQNSHSFKTCFPTDESYWLFPGAQNGVSRQGQLWERQRNKEICHTRPWAMSDMFGKSVCPLEP